MCSKCIDWQFMSTIRSAVERSYYRHFHETRFLTFFSLRKRIQMNRLLRVRPDAVEKTRLNASGCVSRCYGTRTNAVY